MKSLLSTIFRHGVIFRHGGGQRPRPYLATLVGMTSLLAAGGASCVPRLTAPPASSAPVAFIGIPTADDFIRVVNSNSERVQQLQTTGATLTVSGYPPLQANLAIDRPMRLRLRAGTVITGPELDLGSNDELFWIWVKQQFPPAVHYLRHQQRQTGELEDVLGVAPTWLIQAMGLVHLDPQGIHEGPIRRQAGQLELHTRMATAGSPRTQITVVDDARGLVLQQHVLDSQGRTLAWARTSRHEFDPASGTSLPRQVDVLVPAVQLEFTIQVHGFVINQLRSEPDQLWNMPVIAGAEYVDVADPANVGRRAAWLTPRNAVPRADRQALRPWLRRYHGFSAVR